ncbi:hypothetical protein V0R52_16475 [Pseudomonas asiatica]|uniref:hypothetical protein n=1 Tax=Pseudomonas asiatica TaxID=2219225 RepID=UPI002E7AFF4A|nr:hypothetical protein [Pseudomonas asiatica]MEE1917985.1 hypothetical protein [Pseudomonas asiatica]
MDITFNANIVSVEGVSDTGQVRVTIYGPTHEIAAELDIKDRLHDLEPDEIVNHVGASKLLEAIGKQAVLEWLSK